MAGDDGFGDGSRGVLLLRDRREDDSGVCADVSYVFGDDVYGAGGAGAGVVLRGEIGGAEPAPAAEWVLGRRFRQDGIGTARWDNSLGGNGVEAWFYPWGEERGTVTANDRVKFATYRGDSESSLDYAGNRYYDSVTGRFMTVDPYGGSAGRGRRRVGIGMRMWWGIR